MEAESETKGDLLMKTLLLPLTTFPTAALPTQNALETVVMHSKFSLCELRPFLPSVTSCESVAFTPECLSYLHVYKK